MRAGSRAWGLLFLLILVAAAVFFWPRRDTAAAFGPAVALCPGPDLYGYICGGADGIAYVDATQDTGLYADDGSTMLSLPFPFTFYGTTYTEVAASSNGTLQFGSAQPDFANACLTDGPVAAMGDMIAPFWDDLDLTFVGYLETEVVGEAPNRVFVVEWDEVPRFGGEPDDTLTFAVQLFERSGDVVFLYQDVTLLDEGRGASATIGVQSAAQGTALQFSCDQPAVTDVSGLRIAHPAAANEALGLETAVRPAAPAAAMPAAKGVALQIQDRLLRQEMDALNGLRLALAQREPALLLAWQALDLTADGRDELLVWWRPDRQRPDLARLALLAAGTAGPQVVLDVGLAGRGDPLPVVRLLETADLTADGAADALLLDAASGRLLLLTADGGAPRLLTVPERCRGDVGLRDVTGDGVPELLRTGCPGALRLVQTWEGGAFVPLR